MKQYIFLFTTLLTTQAQELHWNWQNINTENIKFPKEFLWGAATAAYHIEGNLYNNNWSAWETQIVDGKPTIKNNEKCGNACDHWNRWQEDFKYLKDLGVNAYRFSMEWSRVEPEEGIFDQSAIDQYKQMCKRLIELNIKPVLTIHHFTNPIWFENLGAFEKQENCKYLVRFAEKIFDEFKEYVDMWCTINEPAVYAAHGYFLGDFPPGKKDLNCAITVLGNLLNTHVEIYNSLKAKDASKQIGIVKQIFQFDPYNSFNPLDRTLCKYLNHIFNDIVLQFFATGNFNAYIPFIINQNFSNAMATKANDFFGLNYYSNIKLKLKLNTKEFFKIKHRNKDIITDIPHTVYAEGIYRALKEVSKLGIPIYITENGIADASDLKRELFLKRYLYAVSKAIDEGVDVRGYFYFSLLDNFEWAEGYTPRFGLMHVDFNNQRRTFRHSSKAFKNFCQNKA